MFLFWKFIAAKPEGAQGRLYDLDVNPEERRDLAAENPATAAALADLLNKYRRQGFSRPMKGRSSSSG